MYVTRPLSLYKRCADALSLPPTESPSSRILVIQDDEVEPTSCLWVGAGRAPQNKNLELFYRSGISLNRTTHFHHLAFLPVLNQPLSSNRFYVIQQHGKHRGEAHISSKEEDLDTCCFFNSTIDIVSLLPLDISNARQQFEIFPRRIRYTFHRGFSAKSVAPDGFPPEFFSRRWRLRASTSCAASLLEAAGVDNALRACLPEFNFFLRNRSS